MNDFVAIDIETANGERTSICAIGAVKVVDGCIVDRFYELVKPEPEYYFRHFTLNIHGIGKSDTENARTFDKVWHDLAVMIGTLPLVAHNKAFDESCIRAATELTVWTTRITNSYVPSPAPGKLYHAASSPLTPSHMCVNFLVSHFITTIMLWLMPRHAQK